MSNPQFMTQTAFKKKIFLVDDHPVLRSGFARLVNLEPDLQVCGEADSATQALSQISLHKPDAAVVDINLRGANGIELVKRLKAVHPNMPVLVLSVHDERQYAERALRAGAKGYVMKQAALDEVMAAIRKVLRGTRYLSRKVQDQMLENISTGSSTGEDPSLNCLSDRELQVFQLIGGGVPTRKIAAQLDLSVKTVETYRAHIKEKLNLQNGTDLMRLAVQMTSRSNNHHNHAPIESRTAARLSA